MADSAYLPEVAVPRLDSRDRPRHLATVRVTHWITTLGFAGLLVSGIAILLAHPRLYWGETGGVGSPSLIDLPLPFVFGLTGWGRHLHFLSAWVCILAGLVYVVHGILSGHFREQLLPAKADLAWSSISRLVAAHLHPRRLAEKVEAYNVLQQIVYLAVVSLVFPLMALTGLAMSPAITSAFPGLVEMFGGQQSARTIHFFGASLLLVFFCVHVGMVCVTGFAKRMRGMIAGTRASDGEGA